VDGCCERGDRAETTRAVAEQKERAQGIVKRLTGSAETSRVTISFILKPVPPPPPEAVSGGRACR